MRALLLTAAGLGLLLLTGCGAAAPSGSRSSAGTETTPTSTPTTLTEPASLLPGSCSDLVSPESVAAALGSPDSTLTPFDESAVYALSEGRSRQAGQLTCRWSVGDGRLYLYLYRHADLVEAGGGGEQPFFSVGGAAAVGADRSSIDCDVSCGIDAQVGDYIFRVDTYPAANRAAMISLSSKLVTELRAHPVADAGPPPAGSWPAVLDCAAIERSGSVAAALSSPHLTVNDTTGYGPADSSVSHEVGHLGGVTECTWGNQDLDIPAGEVSGAYLMTLAGGAWAVDAMLSTTKLTVQPQAIAGADRAATVCDSRSCSLVMRAGVNALVLASRQEATDSFVPADVLVAAGPATLRGVIAAAG